MNDIVLYSAISNLGYITAGEYSKEHFQEYLTPDEYNMAYIKKTYRDNRLFSVEVESTDRNNMSKTQPAELSLANEVKRMMSEYDNFSKIQKMVEFIKDSQEANEKDLVQISLIKLRVEMREERIKLAEAGEYDILYPSPTRYQSASCILIGGNSAHWGYSSMSANTASSG